MRPSIVCGFISILRSKLDAWKLLKIKRGYGQAQAKSMECTYAGNDTSVWLGTALDL